MHPDNLSNEIARRYGYGKLLVVCCLASISFVLLITLN